ncbi:pyrophosphate-energized vacuolar membrane proton pump [Tanacetum coccineum]
MVTRAQVGTVKRNPRFNLHTSHISPLPKSPSIALSDPNWRAAMYDEYNALVKNSTWLLVLKPPNTKWKYSYFWVVSNTTGATSFLYTEYQMCKPALATALFSTIAFVLGAITSIISGFLGMKIATYSNARTTLEARKGVGKAFVVAFRSGAVMGFLLAANGLLVLYIAINLFKLYYGSDWEGLFEAITGYGLGGSSMALFGRVGGGIYTKAADVGADLVGKVERNIPEETLENPAVIADNVGDNVGDIAGMGSDLFGSYAESSCAALVVASISSFGIEHDFTAMCYPLLVSSVGILVCLITTLFATNFYEIKVIDEIQTATKVVYNWHLLLCVCVGLWAGLIIGIVTEYYTSNAYSVLGFAVSCEGGQGVALAVSALFNIDLRRNTTAAIGKGFAIGSAALVSLALFGAFVSRAVIQTVDVLTPKVFIGLIVGAMLPYWFSAMTMKSVGSAALKMVEEVRRQFNTIPGLMEGLAKPDYTTLFSGVEDALGGSGIEGGAKWAGASEHARTLGPKGSEPHKAAVIGDTIGDPLKDTSGPSLNILIKLMAVESLVFAPFFAAHGGLLFKL